MKKIISWLLCISVILAMTSASVMAESTTDTTAPYKIIYHNFENLEEGTLTGPPFGSVMAGGTGVFSVQKENGNKFLRVQQAADDTIYEPYWQNNISNDMFKTAKAVVFEYRIRPNIGGGSGDLCGGSKSDQSYYGVHQPFFYKGKIYSYFNILENDDGKIGTYSTAGDRDWVTVTNVYYADRTDDNKVKREVWLNGELKDTREDNPVTNGNDFITGSFRFTFVLGTSDKTTMSYDLDNLRIYTEPATLDAQLTESDVSSATITMNNMPIAADLTGKITVQTTDGTEAAKVKSYKGVPSANPDPSSAMKFQLDFDKTLNYGTSYKLVINDLKDVAGKTLTKELPFTTGNPEYKMKDAYYYEDYSTRTIGQATTAGAFGASALYGNTDGVYQIVQDGADHKVLRVTQSIPEGGTNNHSTYMLKALNVPVSKYYVYETKVRTNIGEKTLFFDHRSGGGYGVQTFGLYEGRVTSDALDLETVGSYTDAQWVTVASVYYLKETAQSGAATQKQLVRDIYVNGVRKAEAIATTGDLGVLNMESGSGNIVISNRLRNYYNNADRENNGGYVDVDYARMFTSNDVFSAKLNQNTSVGIDCVHVEFNNIPMQTLSNEGGATDELLSKAYVKKADGSGSSIAISSVEHVQGFDVGIGGAAQSVKLYFAEPLEESTAYTLVIDGLHDIAGNTLNDRLNFITGTMTFGDFSFDQSSGKVSVTVDNQTSSMATYTLLVAAYSKEGNILRLENADMAKVQVSANQSAQNFDATVSLNGAEVVKAFLWKDMAPLKSSGEWTIE